MISGPAVPAAIAELERSVRELGLVAAYIDTDIADRTLDAPDLDDFYSAAVELDVPVFIHPSPVGQAGPPDDARLRRFDLDLLLGFSYDETTGVLSYDTLGAGGDNLVTIATLNPGTDLFATDIHVALSV